MKKNAKNARCSLLKAVSDRFAESAGEFAKLTGKPGDAQKYIDLGSIIHRKVCQRLRSVFMWEDRRFLDFDPVIFYTENFLVQIEARKLQSIAHNYRRMLEHMKENGLVCISDHYCHEKDSKRFCKSYTIHPSLLRRAIDTDAEIDLCEADIPKTEWDELLGLAEMAKQIKEVEFQGLKFRFDIDSAMKNVSDDFTKCQKDKYCLTFTKMRTALWAWIDRNRQHQDHVVDFRNFHFLTSMPKAALRYIYDENGNRFHEILDLPSGNILTTAMSLYNDDFIPESEYHNIVDGILDEKNARATYDQFIADTDCTFPRKFVKKCFQIVINCSKRQMARHEKKEKRYSSNPDNIHLRTSKCVIDIRKWMNEKFPNYSRSLQDFYCVPSTSKNEMVKGTYYAFTYIEKILIENIQNSIPTKTIRIHDAIWGFGDVKIGSSQLKRQVDRLTNGPKGKSVRVIRDFISNKVSKGSRHGADSRKNRFPIVV